MELELKVVAKALDLPTGTIERWIKQGRIPIKRRGSICVFEKSLLEKWAHTHHLSLTLSERQDTMHAVEHHGLDSLESVMKRGGVLKDVEGNDMLSIFRAVAMHFFPQSTSSQEILIEKLMQREELVSTGIGKGVAIPHPRSPLPEFFPTPLILTVYLKKAIEFKAIDGRPVLILFFLLCPNTECHLHLLSRLSFCLRDSGFIDFIKTCPEADSLVNRVEIIEKHIEERNKR